MNIIVCIKQVPDSNLVEIDPVNGVLKREGTKVKMNPYDLYALECAQQIKKEIGGTITALTMGPPNAKAVLREAFALGADKGVILTDRKFGGADVLATSYTLAEGIKYLEDYDLIICGKQTIDGDTAQVGPSIAEHLSIPHLSWVEKITHVDANQIEVRQTFDDFDLISNIKFPGVLCVNDGIYQTPLPSYKKLKASASKEIVEITSADLTQSDSSMFGLSGSPTQVEQMFEPEAKADFITIHEENNEETAKALFQHLKEMKVLGDLS